MLTVAVGFDRVRPAHRDNTAPLIRRPIVATQPLIDKPKESVPRPQIVEKPTTNDWTKPQAIAIPKEGYFRLENGRYGPIFPQTPSCYGFSVIGKVKPGREQAMRDYGKNIEQAVKNDPFVLKPLKLHYLRWVLFDVGSGLHFMYQGIFDTDFDKYIEDAIELFNQTGITTVFTNLEGWPEDWRTNVPAVAKFFHDHQCPSFLEYGEYPFITADEVRKALTLKAAFSNMLDQMQ
jgi:hypothetical protein